MIDLKTGLPMTEERLAHFRSITEQRYEEWKGNKVIQAERTARYAYYKKFISWQHRAMQGAGLLK